MTKIILALAVLCIFGESIIAYRRNLKPKSTSPKMHSGSLRQEHQFTNRTFSKWSAAKWKEFQKSFNLPSNEICAIICDPECIEYVCVDGICCTPGSPKSLCCPLDHPLCVKEGCCAAGRPKVCGMYCCEEEESCCAGGCCEQSQTCCGIDCCELNDICCLDHCCDAGDTCCGSGCCELGEICCGGSSCCKQNETCCGEECCSENQTCCTVSGEKKCCNKTTADSCSSELHDSPCPYQFDALQCSEKNKLKKHLPLEATKYKCPDLSKTKVLYRVLRPDESCYDGLKAKAPHATNSALSFVNCGSKDGYTSQYISTTSSFQVARSYQTLIQRSKIAQIDVTKDLLATCSIVNLVNEAERKKYLGNAKSSLFAVGACEYLLTCKARIPCMEL